MECDARALRLALDAQRGCFHAKFARRQSSLPKFFRAPLSFDTERSALVLKREWLDTRLASANPARLQRLEAQVRERVVRREVPKWAPYAHHLEPLIAALRQGGVEVQGLPA